VAIKTDHEREGQRDIKYREKGGEDILSSWRWTEAPGDPGVSLYSQNMIRAFLASFKKQSAILNLISSTNAVLTLQILHRNSSLVILVFSFCFRFYANFKTFISFSEVEGNVRQQQQYFFGHGNIMFWTNCKK